MSVQDTFSTSSALIERVQLQDPAAWKRFAHLYGPLVYYWGRQFGLNPDDASDLAQDVFQTLWKRIDGYSSGNLTLPPEPTPVGMLQCPAGVPEQEAGHAQKTIYPRTDYSEPA